MRTKPGLAAVVADPRALVAPEWRGQRPLDLPARCGGRAGSRVLVGGHARPRTGTTQRSPSGPCPRDTAPAPLPRAASDRRSPQPIAPTGQTDAGHDESTRHRRRPSRRPCRCQETPGYSSSAISRATRRYSPRARTSTGLSSSKASIGRVSQIGMKSRCITRARRSVIAPSSTRRSARVPDGALRPVNQSRTVLGRAPVAAAI